MTKKSHLVDGKNRKKEQSTDALGKEGSIRRDILDGATPCTSKPCKPSAQSSGIRMVNCKNGKRIEFSKKILSALNGPEGIRVLFKKDYLLIVAATDQQGFPLKGQQHNIVYSAALVAEITERFALDFSTHTCASFPEFKGIDSESALAVAVLMK